ncbi:MAG: NUDIX domain-containing protein [Methanobacteriota archaeon]
MVRHTSTALIVRDGRVLLGRRASTVRFAGMWDAFGGHIEAGESPREALDRELREELGIRVTHAEYLEVYEDVDPTSHETFRHHLFLVTDWSGEPRIVAPEHSEIRWFPPADVASLDLMPQLKRAIRSLVVGKA